MEATVETPPETLPRYSACLLCRSRKVKCDGGHPKCGRCRGSNQVCEYKYPVHTSRTRLLQDKIKDIEDKIRAIEQRRESSISAVSQACSIRNTPDSSPANRNTLFSSPISNDSCGLRSPPLAESVSYLLDSDFSSYPAAGCPCIEAAISGRLSSEGLDISPDSLKCMLTIFVHRRGLTGYKLHTGRVLHNLSTSTKPVLALLHAILLTACHFAQDLELKSWETALLERTKSEIEANIVLAHGYGSGGYNALYHLQAMLILSQYYFFKSRMLEGHFYTNNTIQFAIAMGVHRLDSRMIGDYTPAVDLKPRLKRGRWQPQDSVELGEAINLLWGCVARDLIGGVMNGLPPSLPPEEITTVWPFPFAAYMENLTLPNDHYSVKELLDPDSSSTVADVSRDNAACLLIKALVLVHYAGKFDTERVSKPKLTNEWWARFEDCDNAIQRFIETVPSFDTGRSPEEVSHLVLAHTTIDCATLQLHGALAEYEPSWGTQGDLDQYNRPNGRSYARCIAACRNIALITTRLECVDLSYMHMFIAVTWICAGSVLAKQIRRLRECNCTEQLHTMEQDMLILERNMERFLKTYPIFNPWVEQLRAARNW
ncbi:NADPH-dependent diflavin oxidoreductase [Rhizoctonia solani 123E]|uniref:NADPH-dependent diflavin oxidoreductase n=1 Tax=Rhizoctonia solani 123E TaxID=1423351 RepID=A0A074RZJ2_9AGAM|nr:NADPH-dependent diflavin oxidoreductase [Rhizoctonia solani 123E]